MKEYQSLSHTRRDCKYHVVFIPKRRKQRLFGGRERNFVGEVFWTRGYFESMVGLDEEKVRAYVRNQEREDE